MNQSADTSSRHLLQSFSAIETADGAGVRLRRSVGARRGLNFDPFLLLDEFSSDDPDDYIAGFPAHPHRGFETVTYMLDGIMRHEDHLGNRSDLGPGAVQWMRAGRGVIHSEMPQQRNGRMRGFQLWINLPARDKMAPAAYLEYTANEIPQVEDDSGNCLRLVAGALSWGGERLQGAINGERKRVTDPYFVDLTLMADALTSIALPPAHQGLMYVFEGALKTVGGNSETLSEHQLGVLSNGRDLQLAAGSNGARLLLLAAAPIGEPVVQYGPFVMNTRAEIEQAIADYRDGRLTMRDT